MKIQVGLYREDDDTLIPLVDAFNPFLGDGYFQSARQLISSGMYRARIIVTEAAADEPPPARRFGDLIDRTGALIYEEYKGSDFPNTEAILEAFAAEVRREARMGAGEPVVIHHYHHFDTDEESEA